MVVLRRSPAGPTAVRSRARDRPGTPGT